MAHTPVRDGFAFDIIEKVGVPVMAATIVGCLLTRTLEAMHIILFCVGLGFEFLSWRMKRAVDNKSDHQ